MKTNYWLLIGTMIATSAVAQSVNSQPATPAPATTVAASTEAPKKAAPVKKAPVKKFNESPVTLAPGVATVLSENLNVRGQAGLKGEVVARLKKGDTVTVISQINLDKHQVDEPAQWAKIALPAGTKVWVNSKFVDTKDKNVTVKKLNLRAGPGENYSVLGTLERGASVAPIISKGDWTQIEVPANAAAYVAAVFLKQDAAPVTPAIVSNNNPPPVAPPTTTTTVTDAPPVVVQPPVAPAPQDTTPVVTPAVDPKLPLPPRVVTHEGHVRPSVSIVAPTYYELYDKSTGTAINYLYSTTTNLNLGRYNGCKITVTGEEGVDVRWKNTPILVVQKIIVTEAAPVQPTKRATSPRESH